MKRFLMIIGVFMLMSFAKNSFAGHFDPVQYKKDCETVGVKPWISSLKELEKRFEEITGGVISVRNCSHISGAKKRIEDIINHINTKKTSKRCPYKRISQVLKYGFFTKDVEVQEGFSYSYRNVTGFSLIRSYTYTGWRYERLFGIACLCALPAYYYRNDLVSLFNSYVSPLLTRFALK